MGDEELKDLLLVNLSTLLQFTSSLLTLIALLFFRNNIIYDLYSIAEAALTISSGINRLSPAFFFWNWPLTNLFIWQVIFP
jgi:hypothetical protein